MSNKQSKNPGIVDLGKLRRQKTSRNRIKKLEARINKLGEVVDNNANILKVVTTGINIIFQKLGITHEQINKAIADAVQKDINGIQLRSTEAGAPVNDSRLGQSNLSNSEKHGDAAGSSGTEGKTEVRSTNKGSVPDSNG
jgi:hypothetical protein